MSDDALEREEAFDTRQEVFNDLTISELAYAQLVRRCVDHVRKARPAAANPPWVCVGPRNVGGRIISVTQDPVNATTLYAGSAHGGLWRTHDRGDTWTHLGGADFNVPIGALAVHRDRRDLVLVGSGSLEPSYASGIGLFRVRVTPHDDSALFERLAAAPPPDEPPAAATNGSAARYTRIEVDPENAKRFWVASQTGLWRCVIGEANGAPAVWTRDFPPAVAPAGTALLATAATGGNPSWPAYATDLRVAIDPRSADTTPEDGRVMRRYLVLFIAIQSAGIFRGRYDRQANTVLWDPLLAVPNPALGNAFGRGLLALCRADANHVYAVFENQTRALGAPPAAENNHATFVYHSADCGNNWATTATGRIPRAFAYEDDPTNPNPAQRFNDGQASYSLVLEAHPTSPAVVACGEIDLCLSTDSAQTWFPILQWQNYDLGDYAQHADQHVAWFDLHDRRCLWSGNDGGLSLAPDLTAPPAAPGFWRKRSHGIIAGQFQDVTTHSNPQLAFMGGGGLQDNGSWVSTGGPTWYHISGADGGPMAVHASDPRRYLVARQNLVRLNFVTNGPPARLINPVVNDVPALRSSMFVTQSNGAGGGPFVPALEQSPLTAGQVLVGWRTAAGVSAARFLAPPAGNVVGVATQIPLPAPALDAGVEGSAVAFGPLLVPAGPVEGWIGTSIGRIFHALQAPAGAWTNVPGLPVPGGVRHAITRFAVHPTNPAMVAVSTLPGDRRFQITISTGGAPGPAGPARFRIAFANPGGFGAFTAPAPIPAGPFVVAGTAIVLTFGLAAYNAGDGYLVRGDGTVAPLFGAAAGGVMAAALGFAPVTISISSAGAVGAARFTFQAAGLAASAPLVTGGAVDVGATGLVLRFAGGPFVVGHTWTIASNNTIVPGGGAVGTIEVLARLHGRVFLTYNRGALWTDISFPRTRPAAGFDADSGALPPGPVTSVRFAVNGASIDLYAGTLAGVYATTGLPAAAPAVVDAPWRPFNGPAEQALPLTLVNDIEPVAGTRRLRVATFGRGIWDCDLAAGVPQPRLLIRQTLIEDGRTYPRPFPPPIPDDPRLPAGAVWLDHAHAFDIRIDSAPFDFFDDRVDGVEFDERLAVDTLLPLAEQAVYVQVHNWGFADALDVDVHLVFAPAGVAAPILVGGAAPAVAMPAGLPSPTTLYAPPDFNPGGASPWRRVGPPQRIARLRAWEPMVVRFDWRPPLSLAPVAPNNFADVALLALCTAPGDALPAALPAGMDLAGFIAAERRAALRVVQIRARPSAKLFIRDGVDDDSRLGGVAFVGRSPDLIVVQSEPADPAAAFKDLLSTRPQDSILLGGANHVYLRVHNSGLEATEAEVHLWSLAIDELGAASFAPASWTRLTPAAAPHVTVNVPAGASTLAHVAFNNPLDPAPGSEVKSIALVALIRSTDDRDPLPNTATIDSLDRFWAFFGRLFDSDNAALRVLRARS
jgi:hypothetical protein